MSLDGLAACRAANVKRVKYPYRDSVPVDVNHDVRDYGDCSGVVGGLCPVDASPSYVHKNNYNPPTSVPIGRFPVLSLAESAEILRTRAAAKAAWRIERIADGRKVCGADFFQPPPVTLSVLRQWCALNPRTSSPDWLRKDGDVWTAPDCTVGVLRRRDTGKISGFVPCGSWSCGTCGPIKRDRLADKVVAAFDSIVEPARDDEGVYFLTLNLRVPKGKQKVTDSNPTFLNGYVIRGYVPQEEIAACFQRFRSILSKKGYFRGATGEIVKETHYTNKFGTECVRTTRKRLRSDNAYFYVKEFSPPSYTTTSGIVTAGHRRHYHILTNFDVPEDILRDAWWYATNKTSANVDVTRETAEHGKLRAKYITKYINKSMSDETFVADYLPRERRYGKSVGFFSMAFPSLGICFFQSLVN